MNNLDGFYVAYFTGVSGNAVAMFVFRDGNIAGADMGGATYDGAFELADDGRHVEGVMSFNIGVGATLITGASSSGPLQTEVPVKLPVDIAKGHPIQIETPFGSINARFQKIRSFK